MIGEGAHRGRIHSIWLTYALHEPRLVHQPSKKENTIPTSQSRNGRPRDTKQHVQSKPLVVSGTETQNRIDLVPEPQQLMAESIPDPNRRMRFLPLNNKHIQKKSKSKRKQREKKTKW